MRIWVGLDVGVHTTSICVLNAAGEPVREETVATSVSNLDAILRPMRRGNIEIVGMEAGATSTHLARGLEKLKYKVALFECRQASAYLGIRQNKTDRNDARSIAELAMNGRGSVSEVTVKNLECQRIRSMLTARQHFLRMRIGCEAGIGSLFNLYGGKLAKSHSAAVLHANTLAELARLRREQNIDLAEDVAPALAIGESLRNYGDHLNRSLAETAQSIEVCRRFMEIPGVGPLTALSFYSAIYDPNRFERNIDVGPYLGLVPRVRQSGASVIRTRISKMGNTMTRQHLSFAAISLLRSSAKDTRLKEWGLVLRERRGRGRARTAVARKLAIVMLAMWKRGTVFDPMAGARAAQDA